MEDNQFENFERETMTKETSNVPVKKKRKGIPKALWFVLGFVFGSMLGCVVILVSILIVLSVDNGRMNKLANATDFIDPTTISKLNTIEGILDYYYYEDIDKEKLEEGLSYGMLSSVGDPYTVYYSPEEITDMMTELEGNYEGIGAYLQLDTEVGYAKITDFIEGGSAIDAGIAIGDYIVAVNGEEVYGKSLNEVVSMVKGEAGTMVTVTFQGANGKYDVELERKKIETPTVKLEAKEDGIYHLTITEFDTITVSQFEEAYQQAKDGGMKGLIIDLRGNPGGSLDTVVQICNNLLPSGVVVYTEDKYGNKEEYYSSGENEIDVPLAVLIDGGSASASEILSGAIRDYGVGTLIGTNTFGKGVVQKIIPLSDGSAVKVTVSKYFTPNGENINKVGIAPDEEVLFDGEAYLADGTDNQLDYAIEYIKNEIGE